MAPSLAHCSDGFEIGCDNGEKVRVAFALDCCDRESIGFVATTEGFKGEDVQDLMLLAVEARFGRVNRLLQTIEWLTDNGSGYIAARPSAWHAIYGLEAGTTPVQSPRSNGMAEPSSGTIKRDYVRVSSLPDARNVIDTLPTWFEHYNTVHRTRRSAISHHASSSRPGNPSDPVRSFGGNNTAVSRDLPRRTGEGSTRRLRRD